MSAQTDASGFIPPEIKEPEPSNLETKKPETLLSPPSYEISRLEKITVAKREGEDQEQFIERQELLLDPLEYKRNGSNPGLVLIFNQESFEDKPYRLGSRKDVNEIISCMSRLGFNIDERYIFTDCTREEILKIVHAITSQDLSGVNSVIIFFLTHGDSFNTLHAHDYSLKTSDLWEEFAKCEHLKDKPKMFIFQACKGVNHSTTDETDHEIELVPDMTFSSDYIGPDMLIVYSTTEGNVSFRDPMHGTWFIQELCKNFLAYGRRDDVVSLITRTTKCLSRNYYHNQGDVIRKQMPIFVSTLRKRFYLNRSKDRNILNKLVQDQLNMARKLEDLEKKVNEVVQERDKKAK